MFQKYVTKGVKLSDEYFFDRLQHASDHLKSWFNKKLNPPVFTVELGTGWYPVIPVSLFLCGAEKIFTVDISKLTNRERLLTTLKKFSETGVEELKKFIPLKHERFELIESICKNPPSAFEEICSLLHLTCLVQDASKLNFEKNSIDLVTSNNTFEHVYPDALKNILQEFWRVSKVSGIQSHFIDMTDHFAHFDKSISVYHFLRFSNENWKWIDNSVQPMNRFRLSDYLKIYDELKIPVTEKFIRPGNLEELKSQKIDAAFRNYPLEDLAITHARIVSIK